MSGEEMIVAVVAITGGLTFTTFVFSKIAGLIKAWINRTGGEVPADDFNRLAKAFMKYKKDSERRIQNLEAIVAGEDNEPSVHDPEDSPRVSAPSQKLSMDEQEPPENKTRTSDSNLRNMLRE